MHSPLFEQIYAECSKLEQYLEEARQFCDLGKVADYIPELTHANCSMIGLSLLDTNNKNIQLGEYSIPFTLQSISKVLTLILALMDHGEDVVFEYVGMEPTGDVYNSMLKLELVPPGKPFNPLINAGAIVITSLIKGDTPALKYERISNFVKELCGRTNISYNEKVYASEKLTADRNRSLAYFLKDVGVLKGNVDEHLDVYFKQCAIEVTCHDLSRIGMLLANQGVDPITKKEIFPARYAQIASTFMVTCGMYNESGEFAIQVGFPAKSGVSGGIIGFVPHQFGIGVIGPALNDKGNSIGGLHLLKQISKQFKLSIF
ncbi:glutaminase A [Longirhabdus pacifica]|uniref:glutaminase A n=1 Tax=Longirhabdus pacifica TaxID=2305227 RepID=UPI001008BBD1|nr:glutaminase A [Longirhabdus pacifica]